MTITMSVPKGSTTMTEKQAEQMIEAVKEQTLAIQELRREIVSLYNRLGALLPGER